jgi:hypothetical protein
MMFRPHWRGETLRRRQTRVGVAAGVLFAVASSTCAATISLPQQIACGSEMEWTVNGMQFLEGICCDELHESCDPPFPTSCTHADCARAVRKVHAACDSWLASSGIWAVSRKMLSDLLTDCSGTDTLARTVSIAAESGAPTSTPPHITGECCELEISTRSCLLPCALLIIVQYTGTSPQHHLKQIPLTHHQ